MNESAATINARYAGVLGRFELDVAFEVAAHEQGYIVVAPASNS